jgi:hypothetical protein
MAHARSGQQPPRRAVAARVHPRPLLLVDVERIDVVEVLPRQHALAAEDEHARLVDGGRRVRPPRGRRCPRHRHHLPRVGREREGLQRVRQGDFTHEWRSALPRVGWATEDSDRNHALCRAAAAVSALGGTPPAAFVDSLPPLERLREMAMRRVVFVTERKAAYGLRYYVACLGTLEEVSMLDAAHRRARRSVRGIFNVSVDAYIDRNGAVHCMPSKAACSLSCQPARTFSEDTLSSIGALLVLPDDIVVPHTGRHVCPPSRYNLRGAVRTASDGSSGSDAPSLPESSESDGGADDAHVGDKPPSCVCHMRLVHVCLSRTSTGSKVLYGHGDVEQPLRYCGYKATVEGVILGRV